MSTSIARRAASALMKLLRSSADPAVEPGRVLFYAKTVSGVVQAFAETEDGVVTQLTPGVGRMLLPELWSELDVPANRAATALECDVSQLFADYQVIRAGSLTGINLRFDAALTGGSATAELFINGAATGFSVTVSSGASSGRSTQNPGLDAFVAGDLISVKLATTAGFLPDGSLSCEVSVEVDT